MDPRNGTDMTFGICYESGILMIGIPYESGILMIGICYESGILMIGICYESGILMIGICYESGIPMIGNKEIKIDSNDIIADGSRYHGTSGLWPQFTDKDPDGYDESDYHWYIDLLQELAERKKVDQDSTSNLEWNLTYRFEQWVGHSYNPQSLRSIAIWNLHPKIGNHANFYAD